MEENNSKRVVFQKTENLVRVTEAAFRGDSGAINEYLHSFPTGYRFAPSDDELLIAYLQSKACNRFLPLNNIREVNIYKYNPYDLASLYPVCEGDKKEWYFFTPRDRKYPKGGRPNRAAGDGFYKATGPAKDITQKNTGELLGNRNALVFYKGKPSKADKTNWMMHEYTLNQTSPRARQGLHDMRLDDSILVKIYEKTGNDTKAKDVAAAKQKEQNSNTQSLSDVNDDLVPPNSDLESVLDEDGRDVIAAFFTEDIGIESGQNPLYEYLLKQPLPSWDNPQLLHGTCLEYGIGTNYCYNPQVVNDVKAEHYESKPEEWYTTNAESFRSLDHPPVPPDQ